MLAACDSGPAMIPERPLVCTHKPEPSVLWPLTVGNFWEYDYYRKGELTDTIRFEVTEEFEPGRFGPLESFLVERRGVTGETQERIEMWSNGADGAILVGIVGRTDTVRGGPILTYPYPAQKGQEFEAYSYSRDIRTDDPFEISDTTMYYVHDTDEEIRTGVGLFRTYVYRYLRRPNLDAFGDSIYVSYAPGYGPVNLAAYHQRRGRTVTPGWWLRLRDYCIKQPAP